MPAAVSAVPTHSQIPSLLGQQNQVDTDFKENNADSIDCKICPWVFSEGELSGGWLASFYAKIS